MTSTGSELNPITTQLQQIGNNLDASNPQRTLTIDRVPGLPIETHADSQWPQPQLARGDLPSWYVAANTSADALELLLNELASSNFTSVKLTYLPGYRLP
jgi:hypothetical protein